MRKYYPIEAFRMADIAACVNAIVQAQGVTDVEVISVVAKHDPQVLVALVKVSSILVESRLDGTVEDALRSVFWKG